jgi:hypothetical protein
MFMSNNKKKKMTSQSTAFCELSFYTFGKKGYQVAFRDSVVPKVAYLTGAIFEIGACGVPSKTEIIYLWWGETIYHPEVPR